MAKKITQGSGATADNFDERAPQTASCSEDLYRAALELAPFAAADKREILDLGAGWGLLSAKIAAAFPRTLFCLV
jgi:hypothetical protein